MNWVFEINSCKLLYIEWKNNKVILYSTGNSIEYFVINHNWMCVCVCVCVCVYIYIYITESLYCTAEFKAM